MGIINTGLATAISQKLLTYEEFTTIVKEAEAIVNNGPLTYQSTDSRDAPLTPYDLNRGSDILLLPPLHGPAEEYENQVPLTPSHLKRD